MTIEDVKDFVEKQLENAKASTSAESVMNFRAMAFGVIMFAQKFLPYEELSDYWESFSENGMWYKFNNIAREKKR